jgi:hypothetical protein
MIFSTKKPRLFGILSGFCARSAIVRNMQALVENDKELTKA